MSHARFVLESAGIAQVLIDTHAHINGPEFDGDYRVVLDRAVANGVERVICVGYDLPTSERAVALAQEDPRVYATVGLHPNSVSEAPEGWERALQRLMDQPRVVAIGETGLDYYRDRTLHQQQRSALRWHLDVADRLGLPVVIHNRSADGDVTRELLDWSWRRTSFGAPGVLHSFSGGPEMLRSCAEAGWAISFSGMITFANKSLAYLAGLASETPSEALLVETDAPHLAPVPFRGQRNEPAHVRVVAERLAAIRSASLNEIADLTSRNAERVFPGLREAGNA